VRLRRGEGTIEYLETGLLRGPKSLPLLFEPARDESLAYDAQGAAAGSLPHRPR